MNRKGPGGDASWLTPPGGPPTTCTLGVLGRLEEAAFGGGRAVPWAALAGPDAAVLVIWRDPDDQTVHSRGDPWRAELPTIGVAVDLVETNRTVPGQDCAYSGQHSVSSVRRVYRATAFEARTARRLGEHELEGAPVECPSNLAFEYRRATTALIGGVDTDAVFAWAHTLR